jgi:HEXXH motif-containing protein
VNPSQLLWTDTSCYRYRLEKSAAALVAVQRSLATENLQFAEALEFRGSYEFLSRIHPDVFTRVWNDPVAYYWVRRAVHFLAGCRGAPLGTIEQAYCKDVGANGSVEALRIHLNEFKRFVLASALISGENFTFATPFETSLPLSLPGTGVVIAGDGRAAIRGVTDGRIETSAQGWLAPPGSADSSSAGPFLEICPTVEVDGFALSLNPRLFNLAGLGFGGGWTMLSLEFQRQHSNQAAEALAAVARFQPSTFALFAQTVRAVALKPPREGGFGSISSSELPGAFVCSVPCDVYELAATFIHEFHHNRLFYLEEQGSFFEPLEEDAIEGEIHYSPWRDTPRPLHGLLHALYVYIPVLRFWGALVRQQVLAGMQLAYAHDQLARIPFQLRIGVNQLRQHAKFTSYGSTLFEQLAIETSDAESEARSLGCSLHAPAISLRANGVLRPVLAPDGARPLSIGETLRNHLESRDLRGECTREKRLLDRTLSDTSAR